MRAIFSAFRLGLVMSFASLAILFGVSAVASNFAVETEASKPDNDPVEDNLEL